MSSSSATPSAIADVRASCSSISSTLDLVPDVASIDAFLLSLDQPTYDRLRTQHGLTFPLRFPTPTAELNFLAVLALLNALSGYRTAFHTATRAGAYQNIVRLMIGLYISSDSEDRVVGSSNLTAKGMQDLPEAKVVELLGVSVHEERPHESIPGVTVGIKRGEMNDAVQLIHTAITRVGTKLIQLRTPSLGAYLEGLFSKVSELGLGDAEKADYITADLAQTFQEFNDVHIFTHPAEVSGRGVKVYKRIFFLLHALYVRFADRHEYALPDTYATLPMFVDNVIPTLCVWLGLISAPDAAPEGMESLVEWMRTSNSTTLPREKLDSMPANTSGPRLNADETYAVRAAALNVGSAVVSRAKQLASHEGREWLASINEVDLDGYLWSLAKDDPVLRKVPRLVFPSIHF